METTPSFVQLSNFVSPQEYARACGVKVATVYQRFRLKRVAGIRISGKLFIDVVTSPPVADMGRKPPMAPAAKLPPDLPPRSELVCLIPWANKHGQRIEDILIHILYGRIKAWGIAGQVVVSKHTPVTREKLLRTKKRRLLDQ